MQKLKVLIGCEFSGRVRDAFLSMGHDALSCDLLPTEHPGPHYQGDIRDLIRAENWDLAVFHPPCTYLANSGARWLYSNGEKDPGRWDNMRQAAEFFKELLRSPINKICIENPIQHKHAKEIIKTPFSQVIQPWQFGHPESKATCLWLKNLPPLSPTNILQKPPSGRWENQTPGGHNKIPPSKDRWKLRSKTYPGIADAMAQQWGEAGTKKQYKNMSLLDFGVII